MVPLVPSGLPRQSIPVTCKVVDKLPTLTATDVPYVSNLDKVGAVQLVSKLLITVTFAPIRYLCSYLQLVPLLLLSTGT